ncbi:hypothetical protein P7C70_g8330, partial [Phenoliferia sp. Uapishka_3]
QPNRDRRHPSRQRLHPPRRSKGSDPRGFEGEDESMRSTPASLLTDLSTHLPLNTIRFDAQHNTSTRAQLPHFLERTVHRIWEPELESECRRSVDCRARKAGSTFLIDSATLPLVESSAFKATVEGQPLGEKEVADLEEDEDADGQEGADPHLVVVEEQVFVLGEEQLFDPEDDIEDGRLRDHSCYSTSVIVCAKLAPKVIAQVEIVESTSSSPKILIDAPELLTDIVSPFESAAQ